VSNDGPRNYRDLIVWQAAIQLAADVEVVCKRLPRSEWKLVQQLREAARGVHSSIAEGNGRFSIPDYLRFLSMSNASLQEVQSDLLTLRRSNPEDKPIRVALDRTYFVAKVLMRLVESLRRKRDDDKAA
jgi:four helix bundle protein